jgi:hypothetical protein
MIYPVSGCAFIKDNQTGAFCLFESMASVLPLVSEYVVMDLGSTDGTAEALDAIAAHNPKVKVKRGGWPSTDANAFAVLANDLMHHHCENEVCWYHQADEVPHERLLRMVRDRFEAGADDLAFWRVQLGYNFQAPKWLPHVVHRVGRKGPRFNFVGDGMNTDRFMEPPICSDYGGGWFMRWGQMWDAEGVAGLAPYMHQMVLDVSLVGGFRDNVVGRRAMHAPFWHEEPVVPYRREGERHDRQLRGPDWQAEAEADPRWTRADTPFDVPRVMRWHLGRTRYELRQELFDALCAGDEACRAITGV